jgi:asparagine synthase (glutamine-hydrolysing)
VCRLAAERGICVMLSGWGGDEFASYNGRGFRLDEWRSTSALRHLRRLARLARAEGRRHWRGMLEALLAAGVPACVASALDWDVPQWLGAMPGGVGALRAALRDEEWRLLRAEWRSRRLRGGVRENRVALWRLGHLSNRLEDWAREAAPLGVEYRYPLLDRHLVEYGLGLPVEACFDGSRGRLAFRGAVRDILPPEIWGASEKREPVRIAAQTERAHRLGSIPPPLGACPRNKRRGRLRRHGGRREHGDTRRGSRSRACHPRG